MSKSYGGIIEGWYINTLGSVSGRLYNDPMQRWDEGESIATSYIVKIDQELNHLETRNTVYDLGEKSLEMMAIYESAIASLDDVKYSKSVTGLI